MLAQARKRNFASCRAGLAEPLGKYALTTAIELRWTSRYRPSSSNSVVPMLRTISRGSLRE